MKAATLLQCRCYFPIGGYDYEMWNEEHKGQASMEPGAGCFTCSWSGVSGFGARMGRNFDSQKKNCKELGGMTIAYDVEYTPRGDSYIGVYGWTREPLAEFFIVEGWGSRRPPGEGAELKGQVTLNGNTYDIYKTTRYNQPSPYGTVSVYKHFDAWEDAGLDMSGTLGEVSLYIYGSMSDGSAIVKSVSFPIYNEPEEQTSAEQRGDTNGDGVIDVFDLASLRRGILSIMSGTGSSPSNSDVNGDGAVNVADLVCLQRYLLGASKLPDPAAASDGSDA